MGDAQKTPLSRTLSSLATQQALNEIQQLGLRLPGHVVAVNGAIVTVAFDVEGITLPQVTMAAQMSKYMRAPIQVNDLGYATTADAYLGGVTGLGGGTADLTQRGNLSALVWVPVGNKAWSTPDPTASVMTSANGEFVVSVGNSGITMSYSGTTLLQIDTSGNVTINGRVFLEHIHSNIAGGGGAGTYTAPSTGGLITGDSGAVV
ncbi:MAG: hypothetical protein WBW93_14405 [Steroidobacteraceae bacterium]